MFTVKKPERLRPGDTVAAVSLSWGGAGDKEMRWRYELGKRRIEEEFGLRVVEMEHTLAGSAVLRAHPEYRAEDFNQAFRDPSIRGVFSCIGGDDSIRMLPYIDFEAIANNPKLFLGYSDSTIAHFCCWRAGVGSVYGPSILAEFAENVEMFDYTRHWLKKTLFDPSPLGEISASDEWTGEYLEWSPENQNTKKTMQRNMGYELLQGEGRSRGQLIGGCLEVFDMLRGTPLWPKLNEFDDTILFLETSELQPSPDQLGLWLRSYASAGVLAQVAGILWGKPCQEVHDAAYRQIIREVLTEEFDFYDLPVLYNASFGHNEPMCCLPYGAMAEIDCERKAFRILDAAVE